jgi:Tol biopolymer transport system component
MRIISKLLLIFLILIPVRVQSQKIEVLRNERLTRHSDGEFVVSAVSPDGKSVLASEPGYKGLYLINITGKNISKISDTQGAGYKPCFSPDGLNVYFRSDEFTVSGKYSSLLKYDLKFKKTEIVEAKTRNLTPPVPYSNRIAYSAAENRKEIVAGTLEKKSDSDEIYVTVENLKPVLYINGTGKLFTPNGDGNYIWTSLSPDKKKLLYNFRGSSTYVCDLDGNIIANLGRFDAPEWLSNGIIVGMDDKDDGYKVLSSDIICYSLATKTIKKLTSTTDVEEMYPLPFYDGKRIVYQTLDGELFVMSLRIR